MAQIRKFILSNFKGAKLVEIDLKKSQKHPVVTLLGLNESGKTTILEGLSKFVTEDGATKDIFRAQDAADNPSSFIPKHQEANFTGKISIEAIVDLDDADREALDEHLDGATVGKFDCSSLVSSIKVEARYTFKDSDLIESTNYWTNFELQYVPTGKRKALTYVRPSAEDDAKDYWSSATVCISSRIPKITYFPSFLVDVPERIYLRAFKGEGAINKYYRTVLQEVLDSTGESLTLQRHIVQRIEDYKNESAVPSWFSAFFGTDKNKQVDAVFKKMSAAISREIIGNWSRVFQRPTEAKSISLDWSIDSAKEDIPYASFSITDGESTFEVNQRSLGFRWFFSFLLFTRFRRGKNRSTIFLFDEPAANLHAKAQAELLASFGRIVDDGNQIIYSTHSHHMIEPKWLSGAYIIENLAIDHDDTGSLDHFAAKPTEVLATTYRHFLSQSSERSSYYLPALEKLQYSVPPIAESRNIVVVEGISDYHMFRYVSDLKGLEGITFVPGVSASNMGPLLSLLVGLSHNFLIFLDDDKAGRKERDRYRKDWSLDESEALTVGDLNSKFKGKKLETMLSADSREMVREYFSVKRNLQKKQIQVYLAESAASGLHQRLSQETINSIMEIHAQLVQLNHVDNT